MKDDKFIKRMANKNKLEELLGQNKIDIANAIPKGYWENKKQKSVVNLYNKFSEDFSGLTDFLYFDDYDKFQMDIVKNKKLYASLCKYINDYDNNTRLQDKPNLVNNKLLISIINQRKECIPINMLIKEEDLPYLPSFEIENEFFLSNTRLSKFGTYVFYQFYVSNYENNKANMHIKMIDVESKHNFHSKSSTDLLNDSKKFSIHEYTFPNFEVVTNKDSVALQDLRFDYAFMPHKNTPMPEFYELVYEKEVNEPHFHFPIDIASIYKLKPSFKMEQIAEGYAISIPSLIKYLKKLDSIDFNNPSNDDKIYIENDFSMPFLRFKKIRKFLFENQPEIDSLLNSGYDFSGMSNTDIVKLFKEISRTKKNQVGSKSNKSYFEMLIHLLENLREQKDERDYLKMANIVFDVISEQLNRFLKYEFDIDFILDKFEELDYQI